MSAAEKTRPLRPFLAHLSVAEVAEQQAESPAYDAALEMTPGAHDGGSLTQSLLTRADGDPTRDEPTDR